MIAQLEEFFSTMVANFAPFCTSIAVESYLRPILSPGVPGNVIFDKFNSCVGTSIGGDEVYKPHTSICIVSGCWEDWAADIKVVLSWQRFASETGPRV